MCVKQMKHKQVVCHLLPTLLRFNGLGSSWESRLPLRPSVHRGVIMSSSTIRRPPSFRSPTEGDEMREPKSSAKEGHLQEAYPQPDKKMRSNSNTTDSTSPESAQRCDSDGCFAASGTGATWSQGCERGLTPVTKTTSAKRSDNEPQLSRQYAHRKCFVKS